jgi:hypothetical protein
MSRSTGRDRARKRRERPRQRLEYPNIVIDPPGGTCPRANDIARGSYRIWVPCTLRAGGPAQNPVISGTCIYHGCLVPSELEGRVSLKAICTLSTSFR